MALPANADAKDSEAQSALSPGFGASLNRELKLNLGASQVESE
jgi:hypothetical protein